MPRSEVAIPVAPEEVGAEFLTYLWHGAQSGEEQVVDRKPVRIDLGQNIKLKALDGSGAEVALKGDHASSSPELFSALHRGALIVQAKVQLDINGIVVTGTLKADTLTLTGCKLPQEPQKDGGVPVERGERAGGEQELDRNALEDEARLLHRMSLLDEAQDALDKWFDKFLHLRAGKDYRAYDEALRKWVAENVKEQA